MDINQGFGGMNQNFNMGANNGFDMNNDGFGMGANNMGFNNNMNNGMNNMGFNNNMNNGMFMGNNCMNMNNGGMADMMNNNGMFMGNNGMNMNNNMNNMMNNNFGMNPCMNNNMNMNMMANIQAVQLMQNLVNLQNCVAQAAKNFQQMQPQVQAQPPAQTPPQPNSQEDYKSRGFINLYFRQGGDPTNPQLATDGNTPNTIMIQCHLNDKIAVIIEKYRTKSLDREEKNFVFNAKKLILTLTAAESGLNDFSTIFVLKTKDVKGA